MPLNAEDILERLTQQEPIRLEDLNDDHGIYALWDHERNIRYIGVTASEREGFKTRIYRKHVTGTEGRSHKFSQAYNVGRLWRGQRKDGRYSSADAKISKALRSAFCRKHCRATTVTVARPLQSDQYFAALEKIEAAVQELAPASMRRWEGTHFVGVQEPIVLVDALMDELDFSEEARAAVHRQAKLHHEFQLKSA